MLPVPSELPVQTRSVQCCNKPWRRLILWLSWWVASAFVTASKISWLVCWPCFVCCQLPLTSAGILYLLPLPANHSLYNFYHFLVFQKIKSLLCDWYHAIGCSKAIRRLPQYHLHFQHKSLIKFRLWVSLVKVWLSTKRAFTRLWILIWWQNNNCTSMLFRY